ncbi:hypothetical protein [Winogradskyella forsetii]|uniref:hypothetical protein n=1 Tax=Winogradskyella forsetii TaxID=2686077 RepID=UPI0015BDFF79|nr:hypothetical protein [Winogradskyella forsetii]
MSIFSKYGQNELVVSEREAFALNNSGIGRSHKFFGFKAFSNERSVLKQHTFGVTELLFPPYSCFKERLARITIRWF